MVAARLGIAQLLMTWAWAVMACAGVALRPALASAGVMGAGVVGAGDAGAADAWLAPVVGVGQELAGAVAPGGPDVVLSALHGAPSDARVVLAVPDGRGLYQRLGESGLFKGLAGVVKGLPTWEAWGALAARMGWTPEEAADRLLGGGVVVALWDPPGGGSLIDVSGVRLGQAPYAVWCRVSAATQRRVRESLGAEPAAVIDGQPVLRALGGQLWVGVRPVEGGGVVGGGGGGGEGEDARPYWLWLASAEPSEPGVGALTQVAARVRATAGMIDQDGPSRMDERLRRAIARVGGTWPGAAEWGGGGGGGVGVGGLSGRGDVWVMLRQGPGPAGGADARVSVMAVTMDRRAVVITESGYGPATRGARVLAEGAFERLAAGAELALIDLAQPGQEPGAWQGPVGAALQRLAPGVWAQAQRSKVHGIEALMVRRVSLGQGVSERGWGVGVGLCVEADAGLVGAVDQTMGRLVGILEGNVWGSLLGAGVPARGGGAGDTGVWALSPHAERRVRLRTAASASGDGDGAAAGAAAGSGVEVSGRGGGGGSGSGGGGSLLGASLGPRPSVAWRVATEGLWTGWLGPDEESASAGRVGLEGALLGGVGEVIWDAPVAGARDRWVPAERSRGVVTGRLLRGVAGSSRVGRALGGALEWVDRIEWRGLVLSATESSSAVWVFVREAGGGGEAH